MADPAMSILSTSPTSSPQRSSVDTYPMQGYACPMGQTPPMQGQKHGVKNHKQRSGQRLVAAKQAPQAARNVARNNEITQQPPPWTDVTTVMMRNLPNKYQQHMLLEELQLNNFRLQHEFDFIYLPMDHYSAVNLGYCFINFVDPCVANAFAATFQGRRMRQFNSHKTILVMPASMQGYEKNYAYYSSTKVAQAEDPQYRPIFTRPPPCQEAPQSFHPVPAVMWAQQPGPTYQGEWNMQWPPQQPYIGAMQMQPVDVFIDDNPVNFSNFEDIGPAVQNDAAYDKQQQLPCRDDLPEVFSPTRSKLRLRNSFFDMPERSPSVERSLERQCKSCPVSGPQSAVGSAKIEFDTKRPSGLDYAVVAAASCLAMDLGCVASQQERGINSSGGSTTADSESRQRSGSSQFSGSADLPLDVSPSYPGSVPVLGSPQFPSRGSALHNVGSCKPCAFHFAGAEGKACQNGAECAFCHLCDEGEKKRRKKEKQTKKRIRDQTRQGKVLSC